VGESDEYKRYIKNIYVRIMNENLRLFLEEYERKEKMIKMKKFKKTMWYRCCDYCKHDCLMVDEIESILKNYYFNPVRCSFCKVRHLI
jgi:MinD superfamily P-loop ATPase